MVVVVDHVGGGAIDIVAGSASGGGDWWRPLSSSSWGWWQSVFVLAAHQSWGVNFEVVMAVMIGVSPSWVQVCLGGAWAVVA